MDKPLISHNGEFTIKSPRGGHKTFQIKTTLRGKLKGKRILKVLVGPDNTTDYEGFAFVSDDETRFNVWARFKGTDREMYATMLLDMMQNGEASQFAIKGYELLKATVCRKCNRKLTTPESIESGIGPICAGGGMDR